MGTLREAQRVVLSAIGGAFMAGAIAWSSVVSISASYSLLARLLPPVAMFGVGTLLFAVAFFGGSNPRRRALDRAIEDGEAVMRLDDNFSRAQQWSLWEDATIARLREDVGLQAAYDFSGAADSNDADQNLRLQIAVLEDLRRRRAK